MKYYIIAGEASGDLHASNLIKEIRSFDKMAKFRAWGGDLMEQQGATIVKRYRDLAFMGFLEVALNIRTILANLSFCKRDIVEYQPDALILVDYPGFNLRIAKFAHKKNIKTIYYISPQVWAWKKGRVKTIKHVVDQLIVILPFEKEFYRQYGVQPTFVGHPLLDAIENTLTNPDFLEKNNLDLRPIIALLPGSRQQEIGRMLAIMLKIIDNFPDYQFVVAAAPSVEISMFRQVIGNKDVKWVQGQTYALLQHAAAALVTSGTATLETALFEVPQVVCYKGSQISYEIARRLVDIRFISLVNLIMEQEVVKELIQSDLTPDNLTYELKNLLDDPLVKENMQKNYRLLKEKLGGKGASQRAAQSISNFLKA